MCTEIERLQARDQRLEQRLRKHAEWLDRLAEDIAAMDQPGWPNLLRLPKQRRSEPSWTYGLALGATHDDD